MKLVLAFAAAVLLFFSFRWHQGTSVSASPVPSQPELPAPVVVELFTSEGCSSCPPADALLSKLETTQPISGAQVIAIEEHVDYWDHQGWADPFSSWEWTARQHSYAFAFHHDSEYTPQMVVGGRREFVGSHSELAARAIQEARGLPAAEVKLARLSDSGEPRFSVRVGRLPEVSQGDTAEVWLAVTESGLASQVAGGENAGRNLHHASVLRSLKRIGAGDVRAEEASFQQDVAAKLRPEWKRENLMIVVLVQEKKSKHNLGAGALKLAA